MGENTVGTTEQGWVLGEPTAALDLVQRAVHATSRPKIIYQTLKRLFDVVAALAGITMCLPLWAAIAICIKLGSKGPVLFRQKRPGLDGVPFTILKFRTMVADAEDRLSDVMHLNPDKSGSLIRIKKDPRVTRVGRLLRTSSLDETPQLINVLLGHMSLVGPRPISRPISDKRNPIRLRVVPGLTGLWQVSGRKDTGCAFMIDKDLEYICKRSFLYDISIMIQTVMVVVKADGAR